ncbi:hypothetical protein JG687_00012568 [Phytophthora cactorum]|uniref:Uncharacterized protein n=1 Tax=Phytophthora cactorum TaxID=29920 RepID=A0A8T1U3X8_9STRA|nr:hypothetical protein JG687_00012568 [Phytophthora cactorum]
MDRSASQKWRNLPRQTRISTHRKPRASTYHCGILPKDVLCWLLERLTFNSSCAQTVKSNATYSWLIDCHNCHACHRFPKYH